MTVSRALFRTVSWGILLSLPALGVATTITVNSMADTAADDGACTLREAIVAANTNTASGVALGECAAGTDATDAIVFHIPASDVFFLRPASPFPAITEAVRIDGYSQMGTTPNSLAVGSDAVLRVGIDASEADLSSGALLELDASGIGIRGLVIGADADTCVIRIDSNRNSIEGNFLGNGFGASTLLCIVGGTGNRIGGPTPDARNVIVGGSLGIAISGPSFANVVENNYIGVNAAGTLGVGFTDGVRIQNSPGNVVLDNVARGRFAIAITGALSTGNAVRGNFIGTDATGTVALGGGGVGITSGASGNVVGGTTAADRNVISGNGDGVAISFGTGNVVQGNYIGTDVTGTMPLGNTGDGVRIVAADHNTIGGLAPGAGNLIAFNSRSGIEVTETIGNTDGNLILSNAIHSNGLLGLDLTSPSAFMGVTPNDPGDLDTGGNTLQNFPVLTFAGPAGGTMSIVGSLDSTPNTTFRLEFFANDACDPSGFGEGQTFLGAVGLTTDASGRVSFSVNLSAAVVQGQTITATATNSDHGTSEFSRCVAAGQGVASDIPLLSFGMRILLSVALAATGFLFLARNR